MHGLLTRSFEDGRALRLGDHVLLHLVAACVVGLVGRRHVLHHLDEVELLGGLDDLRARAAARQEAICAPATLEVCGFLALVWRLGGIW
jgi:hypothetical protein